MKKQLILFASVALYCVSTRAQINSMDFYPYCFYDWTQDVNNDKTVDTQDVLQIYEFMQLNNGDMNGEAQDVNQDGIIDTQDVLMVYDNMRDPSLKSYVNRGHAINIMHTAIRNIDYYECLLNSATQRLSIFLPTDESLLTYIDPLSLSQAKQYDRPFQMWKFNIDTSSNGLQSIYADIYDVTTQEDGSWVVGENPITNLRGANYNNYPNNPVNNRLVDILRNGIVNEDIVPGKHYYRTLANTFIRIDTDKDGTMTVSGGLQDELNSPAKVIQTRDIVNGHVYVTDSHAYATSRSVFDILSAEPEFSIFFDLIYNADMRTSRLSSYNSLKSVIPNNGFAYSNGRRLMGNYHYTLYAPTNTAMEAAFAAGLPTFEEYDETDDEERITQIQTLWRDFIRYHIQDNAVFVDNENVSDIFCSAKTNPQTGRPYTMRVVAGSDGITVTDGTNSTIKVNTQKVHNQIAREYWGNYSYNNAGTGGLESATTTTVVIHAIDTPLRYSAEQFVYTPDNEYKGASE